MQFLGILRAAGLALMCAGGAIAPTAHAADLLPPISQTNVHRLDVVEAAAGKRIIGSVDFAHREGDAVHYFISWENCALYVAEPEKYPNIERPARLAFFGADIVHRFPHGVRDSAIGPVVAGDPGRFSVTYRNGPIQGVFAFAEAATKRAFERNPEQYLPPVGGYCLGAMAADRVTPGDPRHVYRIAERGIWAVFGSPNGPIAWAKMTPTERAAKYDAAIANYLRKTGLGTPRIAARH